MEQKHPKMMPVNFAINIMFYLFHFNLLSYFPGKNQILQRQEELHQRNLWQLNLDRWYMLELDLMDLIAWRNFFFQKYWVHSRK